MQIGEVLSVLWRRRWIILIVLLVCLGTAALLTAITPRVYLTVATLRVLTPGTGLADSGTWINTQYSDRLNATYLEVLASQPVQQELASRVGLTLETLPDIEVEAVSGTELMDIRVYDEDPRIANTFAQMLQENPFWLFGDRRTAIDALREKLLTSESTLADLRQQYEDIFESANPNRNTVDALRSQIALEEQNYRDLTGQYQAASLLQEVQNASVSIVSPAEPPEQPYRPSIPLNLAMGTAAGIIGGLVLALVIDNLDNALYTTKQIERVAGNSIIGLIPRGKRAKGPQLRLEEGNVLEGFRWLRANVLAEGGSMRSVLVTSAGEGEGKTSIVGNLAVAIAQTNRSVLLIDADLRNPSIHEMFGAVNNAGFSDVLAGTATFDEAAQQLGGMDLYVLTAGSSVDKATDLLSSDHMRAFLKAMAQKFDVILLDSPAATVYSDAIAVAPLVDGVIAVIEQARTDDTELRNLLASMTYVKGNLAGVVVNRADRRARTSMTSVRSRSQGITSATSPLHSPDMQVNGHREPLLGEDVSQRASTV
jgi:capsular exopolysaccharide synthesis family protein